MLAFSFRKGCVTVLAVTLSSLVLSQAPTSWKSVGPGGGGAFFAPTINPYNSLEVSLACDMSGQYRSANFGATWNLTPFTRLQSGRTRQKVQYTEDPLIQYNVDFTGDLMTPVKSTDGGATWHPLTKDPTFGDVWSFSADPTNHLRLIATDYDKMYFSSNGGTTWTQKGVDSSGNGFAVAGVYWEGGTIVVANENGLYASSDSGTTWGYLTTTGIPATEQIVSFAGAKAAAGVARFYCVTLAAGSVYAGILGDDHWGYKSVYTMALGTGKWVKKVGGISAGDHPFYVALARNNTKTAYLAGGSNAGVPIVLKTTDAGATWTSTFKTTNNLNITTGWSGDAGDRTWGYGELVFGFDVCPTNVNKLAFTDYGFCHLSSDGGTNWHQGYVLKATENPAGLQTPKGHFYKTSGLENTSAWTVAWSNKNEVFAGYSDIRGVRSEDAGKSWGFGYTGYSSNSAYQVLKHPTTGKLYMAQTGTHDMYESTHLTDSSMDGGSGGVLVSADKGHTWTPLGTLNRVIVGLSLDPTNPKRLYASVAHSTQGGIYVCQDITAASPTWTKLAVPTRTEGHANTIVVLNDGTLVCTYSGRRTSNFTDSSGVFVSTNGGASWADRSAANMHWWTRDLTVDPTDATQNTWYVGVYSGWGGSANGKGGLYKSIDRGLHWTRVLNSDRVGSCTVNPANGNQVFVATEVEGLWFSNNAASASPTFAQLPQYPFRHPLRVFFNPFVPGEVWVTSFGNGMLIGSMT